MDCTSKLESIFTLIQSIEQRLKEENNIVEANNQRILLTTQLLSKSLENANKILLMDADLTDIHTNLNYILSNINSNRWTGNDSHISALIRHIAYINNVQTKQNLQGYHQVVGKYLSEIALDVKCLMEQITKNKEEIKKQAKDFESQVLSFQNEFEQVAKSYKESFQSFKVECQNEIDEIKALNVKLDGKFDEKLEEIESKTNDKMAKIDEKLNVDIESSKNKIREEYDKVQQEIRELNTLARKQISSLSENLNGNVYEKYANGARNTAWFWYGMTLAVFIVLITCSIRWFVLISYDSINYLNLFAKTIATIGIGGVAGYCSMQASKSKILETKMRKIQLQMMSFDTFVANLGEKERTALKVELTKKFINQKDWLKPEKKEYDIVEDFNQILKHFDCKITKTDKIEQDEEV